MCDSVSDREQDRRESSRKESEMMENDSLILHSHSLTVTSKCNRNERTDHENHDSSCAPTAAYLAMTWQSVALAHRSQSRKVM